MKPTSILPEVRASIWTVGVHLIERKPDIGVQLAVVADDAGEEVARAPEKEADGQGADLAMNRAAGDVYGALGGGEGFSRLFEEDLTVGGEPGLAGSAIE